MTDGYGLELTRPEFLFGLVALPLLAWYFHRSLVDLPRRQRWVSLVVRSLIVLLLVLSLAGLMLLEPTRELFVIFAVDQSLSVSEESRSETTRFIEQAKRQAGDNQFAVLPFAAEPGEIDGEPEKVRAKRKRTEEEIEKGTDIAGTIEVAAAAIPPHYVPRIVLLTDGNETRGDALRAALSGGITIDAVPLQTRDEPEVQVARVDVPAQVAQGEPFYVEAVVDSNHDDEVRIDVFRGPHRIAGETHSIKQGENVFRFRQSIDRDRLAEYT
ncbi:MAG: hypothetical protein ACREJB_07700, partial [Planctomycetaceae bacterium]